MRKLNVKNEPVKHRYLAWLEEAQGRDRKTADMAAAAIHVFEQSTGFRDFKNFHREQAIKFKRDLRDAVNPKTKKPLAKATIYSRLKAVQKFFSWLADQPGYKSRLHRPDFEYFNITDNEGRMAKASRERPFPSVDQVRQVVLSSPSGSPIEKRDRALIAFTLLTGARISALASLQLQHLDIESRCVFQDARDVRTKHRKTFPTYFFPMGEELIRIIAEWVDYLQDVERFGPCDPLFPATKNDLNDKGFFEASGLAREHWKQSGSIRDIFRSRFKAAGLPYFNPHSLRKTIMQEAYKRKLDLEALKAWSQNLGHEDTKTTIDSYGPVSRHRQAEILADQSITSEAPGSETPSPEEIRRVLDHLKQNAS